MHQQEHIKPVAMPSNGNGDVNAQAPRAKYNDLIWAMLFVANVVGICIVASANVKNFNSEASSSSTPKQTIPPKEKDALIIGFAIGFIGSVIFSVIWMRILQIPRVSQGLIKFAILVNVAIMALFAFTALMAGAVAAAVIAFILIGITMVWYWMARNRIEFTSILLEMATSCIRQYSSSIYIAIVMQLVGIAWCVVWLIAVLGSSTNNSLVVFLLVLSLYWTSNVLMNIVHVTAGGVAATWYYQSQTSGVTSSSAKRAMTTSFGSICFGSLIVSLIEVFRQIARSSTKDNDCLRIVADCIIGCIESIAKFVTKYAYAYVSIWGQDFCTAAKNTFELLQSRGFDVIINDDLSGLAFWMSSLIGGVVTALIGGFAHMAADGEDTSYRGAVFVLCFFLGAFITGVVMSVLASCVVVFMVVFAEDPATLAVKHPQFHQKLSNAISRMYPTVRIR